MELVVIIVLQKVSKQLVNITRGYTKLEPRTDFGVDSMQLSLSTDGIKCTAIFYPAYSRP